MAYLLHKNTAKNYANVNECQLQHGSWLLKSLGAIRGLKVLDMGCGTGELTSVIANQVGSEGEVVGIDPDEGRIKVAVEKHGRFNNNFSFAVGDSSSNGHHLDEEYYDIHFSNFVLQWLTIKEKEDFVKVAFKCLKPGGRIAIESHEENPTVVKEFYKLVSKHEINSSATPRVYLAHKSLIESLLEKAGFVIISSEYVPIDYMFPSVDSFITWCCASDYVDEKKIPAEKRKAFACMFANNDGTLKFLEPTVYHIIAKKPKRKSW